MSEIWHEGPELNLNVGMTVEEIRCVALGAAANCWAGLSAVSDRNGEIIKTAERFYLWLTNTRPTEAADA